MTIIHRIEIRIIYISGKFNYFSIDNIIVTELIATLQIILHFIFAVPTPVIFVTILGSTMVGETLVLQCVVTAVEGITVGVDIVWRKDGSEFIRVDEPFRTPAVNGSVQYTDVQEVATRDHDAIYQCEMIINTSTPVVTSKELQLAISGNVSSKNKFIAFSNTTNYCDLVYTSLAP